MKQKNVEMAEMSEYIYKTHIHLYTYMQTWNVGKYILLKWRSWTQFCVPQFCHLKSASMVNSDCLRDYEISQMFLVIFPKFIFLLLFYFFPYILVSTYLLSFNLPFLPCSSFLFIYLFLTSVLSPPLLYVQRVFVIYIYIPEKEKEECMRHENQSLPFM